jgi:hypothetical protein
VVLLVQITERDRIGKQLVEIFDAFLAHVLGERNGQLHQVPEWLDLMCLLVDQRLRAIQDWVCINQTFSHRASRR